MNNYYRPEPHYWSVVSQYWLIVMAQLHDNYLWRFDHYCSKCLDFNNYYIQAESISPDYCCSQDDLIGSLLPTAGLGVVNCGIHCLRLRSCVRTSVDQVWIKCGSSVDQVWVKSTLSSVWRTCQITCGAGLCTSADLWPCSLFKLNKVQLKLKVMSLGNLLLRQLHNNSSNVMSVCHLTAQYS